MSVELPPDPSLDLSNDSDKLSENRAKLDVCCQAFKEFADDFAALPSIKNYRKFKKTHKMLSSAFGAYVSSIADLEELDDSTKCQLTAELFLEDQQTRVNTLNELVGSEEFTIAIPADLEDIIEIVEEEDEEALNENDEKEEVIYKSELSLEEWMAKIMYHQRMYAESDFDKLVNYIYGPKFAKFKELGSKAKKPTIEIAKMAGAASLAVLISKQLENRSPKIT